MLATAIVLIIAGVVVLWTALRGRAGTLPRNWVIGVRTESALESDEAFTVANRVAWVGTAVGAAAFIGGGILMAIGLVLVWPEGVQGWIAVGACVVGAAGVVVGGARGSRAARQIRDEPRA